MLQAQDDGLYLRRVEGCGSSESGNHRSGSCKEQWSEAWISVEWKTTAGQVEEGVSPGSWGSRSVPAGPLKLDIQVVPSFPGVCLGRRGQQTSGEVRCLKVFAGSSGLSSVRASCVGGGGEEDQCFLCRCVDETPNTMAKKHSSSEDWKNASVEDEVGKERGSDEKGIHSHSFPRRGTVFHLMVKVSLIFSFFESLVLDRSE